MTGRPSSDPRDIWQQARHGAQRHGGRQGSVQPPRGGRRPPGRRWPAAVGYGALALVCLGLAAVAFLVVAPPLDGVRERLIERFNARTGATLAIAGPASLSLFPRPAVSFSDVAVVGAEGRDGAAIARVPSVDIEVSLWSLLLRQPRVGQVTFNRPTIELIVDGQGRRNWEFAGAGRKRGPTAAADAGGSPPAPTERSRAATRAAERIAGGSVRVIDAALRYRDERTGSRYEIDALNLVATAGDVGEPSEIDGTLVWRGVEVRFSGTAAPLREMLGDRPAPLSFRVSAVPVEASYQGTLGLKGGLSADGKVSLKAPSAQALRDWLGTAWPGGSAADPLTFAAQLAAAGERITLSSLEASLGDAVLAGSVAVELKGRPKVTGKLQVSELDLGRLLVRQSERAGAPAVAAPAAGGPPQPAEAGRHAKPKGWSEEAIDPQVLARADADLTLSVERLVYAGVKMGPGRLAAVVDAGVAKVVLDDIQLYGGRGQGRLTLDGSGATLAVAASLKLADVSLRPLLGDAAGVQWLDGRGAITLALSSSGLSERQIVEALAGKVDVAVADGAIRGIDVGKVMRDLQRGRLLNLVPATDDRTPFSELAGTFDITNGIARSQDLRLVGTHLQLTGAGAIELGPRRIDYTLNTKISGGPADDSAALKIGTLQVPIGIKGPLNAPKFAVLGQDNVTDTLKTIGKNLRSREVQDALEGLLSGDKEKRVKPRELIDKLLKKE
jgi:AsmA protein